MPLEQPGCEATIFPTKKQIVNAFCDLARLPADLVIAGLDEEAQKIRNVLDSIESAISGFPLGSTTPWFQGINIPEIEWEQRITAIIQNFHGYVIVKMLQLIDAVIPVNFTVNVFGLSIDIVQFFTNPSYSVTLKNQIAENLDSFFNSLSSVFQTFNGKFGLNDPAQRLEAFWSNLLSKLNGNVLELLVEFVDKLIDKFKSIWNSLGLPSFDGLLLIDIPSLFTSVIDDAEKSIAEKIAWLESFSIAGYNIVSMIGGEIKEKVTHPERYINRFIEAARKFAVEYPKKLFFEWLDIITAFFNAIGLSALVEWISFTFCDFLELIGIPTTLELPEGVTEDMLPA